MSERLNSERTARIFRLFRIWRCLQQRLKVDGAISRNSSTGSLFATLELPHTYCKRKLTRRKEKMDEHLFWSRNKRCSYTKLLALQPTKPHPQEML